MELRISKASSQTSYRSCSPQTMPVKTATDNTTVAVTIIFISKINKIRHSNHTVNTKAKIEHLYYYINIYVLSIIYIYIYMYILYKSDDDMIFVRSHMK